MQSGPPIPVPTKVRVVDRDAIARTERRRQAREALVFERERVSALQEQIHLLVVELDGRRIDEEAFAQMRPDDVALAQALLDPQEEAVEESGEDGWLGDDPPETEEPGFDPRQEAEEEIARLESEIEDGRRRQEALEAYIAALDAPS
jgi:hypothetical protein